MAAEKVPEARSVLNGEGGRGVEVAVEHLQQP